MAFIPTAALHEDYNQYVEDGRLALERMEFRVEVLEITQKTVGEIERTLERNECVYVSGGNPFFLMQELRRKGADREIVRQVEEGKLYIGESAGSMIAAPDVEYAREMDEVETVYTPDFRDFSALGLVGFYTVPHYGCPPFEVAAEAILQKYRCLDLKPISNSQVICVEGDRTEVRSRERRVEGYNE